MKSIVHSVLRPLASVLCLLSLVLPSFSITATKEYVDRQDKKKLDLPAVTIPTNFVPVTIGEGRVAWKLMQGGGGGGGGSLGKVTQLQDESGKWHNVSSAWNSVTLKYDLVIDPAEAPHEEMTVQQEMERAVGAETMLLETNTWETAERIAADEYLKSLYDSLSTLGRLVSTYDTSTGKPTTEPKDDILVYKQGDYYIVGKVAEGAYPTNFIPHGAVYYKGSTSTTVAPDEVYVNDVYRYTSDGTWVHVTMKGAPIPWTQIAGNPLDNTNFVAGVHTVTTGTVTKAYVEGLGIQSCDTNKVNDLIGLYDATNLTPRIDYAISNANNKVEADYTTYVTNGIVTYRFGSDEWYVDYYKNELGSFVLMEGHPKCGPNSLSSVDKIVDSPPRKAWCIYKTSWGESSAEMGCWISYEDCTGKCGFTSAYDIVGTPEYTRPILGPDTKIITNRFDTVTKIIDLTDSRVMTNLEFATDIKLGGIRIGEGLSTTGLTYYAVEHERIVGIPDTLYSRYDPDHIRKIGIRAVELYEKTTSGEFKIRDDLYLVRLDEGLFEFYLKTLTSTYNYWAWFTGERESYAIERLCAITEERVVELIQEIISSNKVATTSSSKIIRLSTSAVDTNIRNIGNLETNKVDNPATSVPAGYSLVRGTTNLTDWVLLPSTNIVGYLGYIRDTSGNAYRVIAEPNPAGSIVASIEQTPTPMPIITIDEERDARIAGDLALTNYANLVALSSTNYTDTATGDVVRVMLPIVLERATTNDLINATNDLAGVLLPFIFERPTTNDLINATNDLAGVLLPLVFERPTTNDLIAATNALDTAHIAALSAEATARAAADTDLTNAIAAETTARADADTALGSAIAAAATTATNYTDAATNTLSDALAAETARAINAENAEKTRAMGAETALQSSIDGLAATVDTKITNPSGGSAGHVLKKTDSGEEWGPVVTPPTTWGSITGTLADQADLVSALASKQNNLPDAIPDYYLHSNYDTGELEWKAVTGGGGTGNYNELTNKPKIENHLLSGGNNTAASLGLQTNLVVDATVANKVLKNDGSTIFWGEGGGSGSGDYIPITKTVASATDIKNLFELSFEKSWDDIPQNSSMIVYATGLPYADNTFPNSEGYCILRYRTYRYAYIEFVCPTVIKNGTKFNKMQNGTWKGWTDPPLPIFNINSPTSYMDLFNKMGYVYGMDGFTASGIATGLNIDPAKGDYFPHPNCYVTVSSLNNACYRIQASGFNQTGVLWERREESGDWRPWTRIDGNVSQKTIWGDYKDCDSVFLEAFCATNSQPDKATITGYAYNLNTSYFPEQTGFLTMRQVDSNNKQIEFRSTNPDTPVKYNTKTNGVWTGWKSSDPLQTTALILNGGPEQITGPMVVPNGYGTAGQVLVSNGSSTPPSWGDIFDIIYPVGSIYISVGSTIPTAFTQGGRTWEKLSDGQFLMNTTGTTGVSGGSNSRTLTTANMPAHTHGPGTLNLTGEVGRNGGSGLMTDGSYSSGVFRSGGSRSYGPAADVSGTFYMIKFQASGNWSGATASVGSGTAFDNRPSYLSVSMWKRTN